ncbi:MULTISPECIES: DUF4957 domain-containing protein [Rhodonellum]|nr:MULTISPECIES: DUF4957 domain-containing protein [Rhodonellum]
MKNHKKLIPSYLTSLFLLGAVLLSCTDIADDYDVPKDMKRFRPVTLTASNGETAVTLSWPEALFTDPGEVTYTLQVAKDSLFSTIELELVTEATTTVITDDVLDIKVDYYGRIRANGLTPAQNSEWVRSQAFQISGEQIFLPTFDNEIGSNTALLRWRANANPSRIVLTDPTGNNIEFLISDEEKGAATKILEGLNPFTEYLAEIFEGNRTKGITSFVTKEPSIYDIMVSPADNFREIVEGAEDGALIGLQPGVYDIVDETGAYANLRIVGKTIHLASVSGDPADTKVNFKEFSFAENGAGLSTDGITFDGQAGTGDYFLNFTGGATTFTQVTIQNSIVENVRVSFLRANRAGNNAHKIDLIKVSNSILRNHLVANYYVFHLDKLEFRELEVTNSTFSNLGSRGFIGWATNLTMPFVPIIRVTNVTINGIGSNARNNSFLDANNNEVDFQMSNSILNNMPLDGNTVGASLLRAGSSGQVSISNSNLFNLNTGGADSAPLSIADYVTLPNVTNVDLGWTSATVDLTLPAASPLRTAATNGGPIGDPRWAF